MNNSEVQVIRNVIAALKGDGSASPEIMEMLADRRFRSWCDTWVSGALEVLVMENRTPRDLKLAVSLSGK